MFASQHAPGQLPSRKWSIVVSSAIGAVAVILSYVVFLFTAIAFLLVPCVYLIVFFSWDIVFLLVGSFFFASGIVTGVTILWALIPRRDKFQAPGILIDLSQETRLAAEIELIATALHEAMPAQVYLIADANAFVAQPRGMTGVGKGRVLALGLPLLQVLTIAEFRAILAHEFAHFYSGDTRLAPWVYKARSTMVRVFQNLNKKSEVISVLTRFAIIALVHMVLMGGLTLYWKFFIWITQLISRRQEYRCDELACHIAGSDALIEALRKLRKSAAILGPYWSTIVLPIASSGYQPQIADGFARFLAAPQNEKTASDVLEKEISSTKSNTLDTHPPLSKRIVRARSIGIAMTQDDVRPAVSLIDHLGPLEADLLRRMIPALKTTELKPMSWETAGVDVYVPLWRKQIAGCLPLFLNETLATFPELIVGSRPLADKILNPPGMLLNSTQREDRAMGLLVPALALSLYEKGWALHIQPGAFYLDHNSLRLQPREVVVRLRTGAMSSAEWQTFCARADMSTWPLVRLASSA